METRAQFVVLAGIHDGVCVRLANAVTLVGSGGACDVVLRDAGIGALHASITVGGDNPIVRWHAAVAGDRVDGDIVDSAAAAAGRDADGNADIETPWYLPFRIGPAWVAVVPADFEWEASTPWPARRAEPAAPAAASDRPARRFIIALAGGLGLAAFIALLVGLSAGGFVAMTTSNGGFGTEDRPQREPAAIGSTTQTGVARLSRIIAELELADVTVEADADRLALNGFVETDAQLERLGRTVKAAAPPGLLMRVTVGSELARRAQEFLSDPGIAVAYEGGGRIRLAGRPVELKNRAALQARLAQLRADLGPTIEIRDDIAHAFAAGPPVEHRMPIRIAEVQADEPAHFRTVDGARYFEGARLPDGAEVVRISANEIVFRKAGREISYAVVE